MNWKSPCADDVEAPALGLKSDSILAVASRYSKLAPVVFAACLIAPATRAREVSTPAVAWAFEVSTDMKCSAPADRIGCLGVFSPKKALSSRTPCGDYG